MTSTLAEYEKKQAELKTLGEKLEADLTLELKQHLTKIVECAYKITEINGRSDIKELPEWKAFLDEFSLKRKSVAEVMRENPALEKPAKKRKKKKAKGKPAFKLSDAKANEILDFIGKSEKSTQQIADKLKTKNASNALTYLKEQGKIVVARKEGLKKFWKRA